MFQATRRRLALWYTTVTAVLLLLFASGFYLYVRNTLIERIDDTLSHVAEVVQRSLVIEPVEGADPSTAESTLRVNLEASFRSNADAVEDDHIDLEWFSPTGELLWSTFSAPLDLPLHVNHKGENKGETVYGHLKLSPPPETAETPWLDPSLFALRQITQRVQVADQLLGYLRVSHPWFEVTKPSRQLIRDLGLGVVLVVGAVAAIGWFLSGLAMAPVHDSYQRLKQFTADASHELRNPIAVIQTNVQVALADPDPTLQQDQLRIVERLTRRLGKLVDDLLFLARQDSGMSPLQMGTVSLDQLLHEVIEEQQVIAAEKSLQLSLDLDGPAAVVQGDADQLMRLFTNVISNAISYTPNQGQIEVKRQRLKVAGLPVIQVQVKDTGIGIPAESLPHLFDRFYRVDPARTSSSAATQRQATTGSGLGLAIAKVIAENHHGQIQVESKLHQGTTVTVTLPLHRAAEG